MNKLTEKEIQQKLQFLIGLKKTLFVLNYIIWIAGGASWSLGIYYKIEDDFTEIYTQIEDTEIDFDLIYAYFGADILLIAGSIFAVAALIGALSIIKENFAFLLIYSFFVIVVFALYLTCAIWGFVRFDYLKGIISDFMREVFKKAREEKEQGSRYATMMVNEFQINLMCCGNVGPSDYAGDIPPSCQSFVIGCNEALYEFYALDLMVQSIVSIVFAVLHLITFFLTIYFSIEVRKASKIARENYKRRMAFIQMLYSSMMEKRALLPPPEESQEEDV